MAAERRCRGFMGSGHPRRSEELGYEQDSSESWTEPGSGPGGDVMGQSEAGSDGYGPAIWPSFETLRGVLSAWQNTYASVMRTDIVGLSGQGRPVYAVELTDHSVPDEDKEHVLLSALHAGVERSAATTIFALMEWLLEQDPLACEILRRQVIVCMPVPNPDCYEAGSHGRVYSEWTLDGPACPDGVPEAVAVQAVMDRYQPEVHADIHGMSMAFARYSMLENSGSSYSNLASRSYNREIVRLMDEAALAEGYPSDLQESDSERIFWGPELAAIADKLWVGRPRIYASIYCYNLYHSLLSASEICWERSGLVRHRRLFEVGNAVWPGEYYPGYPTRVVASNGYHMLTAYGGTAGARRRSRVELWQRVAGLFPGMIDPMVEGKIMYVCATSHAAAGRWLAEPALERFVARLSQHDGVDTEPICRFVAGWPAGQNGPEAFLTTQPSERASGQALREPIAHGLAMRLRLPYERAALVDLRLNGHPLRRSESNGFVEWVARGYTYVQINIPPERTRAEELFVVTCEYDPREIRGHWSPAVCASR